MSEKRPLGRQRNVQGTAGGVERHGDGLGTGPVGQAAGSGDGRSQPQAGRAQGRPAARPRTPQGTAGGIFHGTQGGYGQASSSSGQRPYGASGGSGSNRPSSGGGSQGPKKGGFPPILIIIVLIALLGGGGGSFLFGGSDQSQNSGYQSSGYVQTVEYTATPYVQTTPRVTEAPRPTATPRATATPRKARATRRPSATKRPGTSWLSETMGSSQTVNADSTVVGTAASGLRAPYTQMLGGGKDTVTLMVYMCGTDLESRSGMASSDLREMASASYGDNVRILIYTGGCKSWKISGISNAHNQIWQLKDKKLTKLVDNDGNATMTNPATLTRFIRYCAKEYPASRYELILWDHGGGSVSGYGYDEKNASSGSMSLSGLNTALADAGVKFDFIGFDACLMATVETALMSSRYADYMIASEESEPGIGWYYTDWLTALGRNTSMDTPSLGKMICDDFVSACARSARGQTTTLSVTDLAQVEAQVPKALSGFANSISQLIENKAYTTVSNARNGSREFAQASRIDQVDLADLAQRMGNQEGKELYDVIRSCVKYNRTSGVSNAYGLSIYFPYKKVSNVDKAVRTYQQIGMDSAYSDCIRAFASLEASGQIATGGSTNPLGSLLGQSYSSYGSSSTYSSEDLIGDLLSSFLGGGSSSYSSSGSYSSYSGLDFLFGKGLTQEATTEYIFENHLDGRDLVFEQDGSRMIMSLPEDDWELVHGIDQNVFVDDGKGFIDLGLDNVYSFDDEGCLVADLTGVWLSIDGQVVPYYHTDTIEDADGFRITGYIPALVNGERRNLYVVFDQDHDYGQIVGTQTVYGEGTTETSAKLDGVLQAGDTLRFVCDYYAYDGTYSDTYLFGNPVTVGEDIRVVDAYLEDSPKLQITYRIQDIYNQNWWTNAIHLGT